ncbi:MAG TPA: polyprenyl synthetase family protein [Patescibacteria group bacterium]|nr:polyprenyl synthetase family protein [Patescibacteria group bacterium]
MNFTDYLLSKKKNIHDEVELALTTWKKKTDRQSSHLKRLTKLLVNSNKEGKHIRGALVCLGYELVSQQQMKDLYKVSAGYEIMHTALLIHDDIMDKSATRRGRPTLYRALGGNHYGMSQAISLGDAGFFLAIDMLNRSRIPEKRKATVLSFFFEIILQTINGQMLDIALAHKLAAFSEKDVLKIAQYKTAYYTLVGPLVIGALLAGAGKRSIERLTSFGEHLGIAFQLQDDLLGIFGDENILGKSTSSDIEEGKNTLLFINAFMNATDEQKTFLMNTYGNGTISKKQQQTIQDIFLATGARDLVTQKILHHAKKAEGMITSITKKREQQQLLETFIAFLTSRNI